ncbi:type II toxin-antitoxin system RelE/ParE family toxin [Thalassospira sp.]|uniref:type II toxin-antitoxin system RelE/ParE family toxin n=1 Tax=Thalassospira sp. TaxID=1912094 RepID=UPI0035232ED8
MKIAWAKTALADLRDIIDYIEIRNRVAAKTTYHLISGSVSQLANHPFIGRAGYRDTRDDCKRDAISGDLQTCRKPDRYHCGASWFPQMAD